jgi:DNA-binding IclR family transcriptional regulator
MKIISPLLRADDFRAIQWHYQSVITRGQKPPVGEPVLDRAVRLLDAFEPSGEGLTLAELVRRSGLAPSTALRLARKMTDLGLLERPDGNHFIVGIRMLELASRAPRGQGIRTVALPYMEELHRATGHYVMLGVRDGDEAVLVERLTPPGASEPFYTVGDRMPLAATGLGLALLAFTSDEYQAKYFSTPRIIEPEGKIVDVAALRIRLEGVRHDGVASIGRSVGPRYASVACPIFGLHAEPLASISIVAPPLTLVPAAVRTALVAIAGAISRRLGGPGGVRR